MKQYISDEQFETLFNSAIQLKFKKGEHLLKQNNKFTHVAYLHKGRVKFNYENEFGKNLVLTVVNSPILLGGANLFNEDTNLFSITAIEDCEACMLDVSILKKLVINNSALAIHLLEFTTSLFKSSILNFVSLVHKQVNGRIADILIYLSQKIYKSENFMLTLTRKELAEFAGCSQENVIHTLTRFHKEGIIKLEGKNIEIIDGNRLSEINRLG
ncbi:MAG: Crp/Fnr family transcriptional regulator [Bacteroidales bacterium]|jgi:CRP/FNR family transcriptional regulator